MMNDENLKKNLTQINADLRRLKDKFCNHEDKKNTKKNKKDNGHKKAQKVQKNLTQINVGVFEKS